MRHSDWIANTITLRQAYAATAKQIGKRHAEAWDSPEDDEEREDMQAEHTEEHAIYADMVALWHRMKAAKPTERSEVARRYAVSMTEFEKVMAYFELFVVGKYPLE
jgi:hypothetical protein